MKARLVNDSLNFIKAAKKPVDESFLDNRYEKDELIDKIMQTVYADDDPAKDADNERYLETLSIEELEAKLQDYITSEEDDDYYDDEYDEDEDENEDEDEESGIPDHYPEHPGNNWSWR